jgi:hypothetical protein
MHRQAKRIVVKCTKVARSYDDELWGEFDSGTATLKRAVIKPNATQSDLFTENPIPSFSEIEWIVEITTNFYTCTENKARSVMARHDVM